MDWRRMSDGRIEEIRFRNRRGQQLCGTIHRPKAERGLGAIVCHGMLSSRASAKHVGLCNTLARHGVRALRFDFSGRGESEGATRDLTYEGQVEDLDAALDLDWSGLRHLVLIGSSMGGAVAILAAAARSTLASVMGIATACRPDEILRRLVPSDEELRRWEVEGEHDLLGHRIGWGLVESGRRVDVIGAASRLSCPLLLVHGEVDEIAPLDHARELAEAAKGSRLEVISGGDHVLHRPSDQAALEGFALEIIGALA
jgi:uncharacterized protein